MGRGSRPKPARLPEKLLKLRNAFGLSQNEMIRRLGLTDELYQYDISALERGVREPPLPVLLKYAQVAGVWVDVLIDDELDLPERLPCTPKHEGLKRKRTSSRKKQYG